jgi:hypothetical protein
VLPGEERAKEVREIEFFLAETMCNTVLHESGIVASAGCDGCCLDDNGLESVVGSQIYNWKRRRRPAAAQ